MKNTIFFFIGFFLISIHSFGQIDSVFIRKNINWENESLIYKTDTILFKSEMYRNILTGTSIIPNTQKQKDAIGNGIELEKVTYSDCDSKENPYKGKNRINSIIKTDSTLIIDLKIFDNCCYSFLCDLEIVNNKVLNLICIGYGDTYCACDCCHGLTFQIVRPEYIDKIDIDSIIINGDFETIKPINE